MKLQDQAAELQSAARAVLDDMLYLIQNSEGVFLRDENEITLWKDLLAGGGTPWWLGSIQKLSDLLDQIEQGEGNNLFEAKGD
jgi:hypothetical protein